jgi:hypothetical protein
MIIKKVICNLQKEQKKKMMVIEIERNSLFDGLLSFFILSNL